MPINSTPSGQMPGVPATIRASQVKKLSGQMPGLIQQNAAAAQNSQMLKLQQAVQQTVGSGSQITQGQVQQTGAQVSQAKGQAGLQKMQQGVQAENQLAQLGVNEQQQQRNYELAQKQIQLEKDNRDLVNKLDEVNSNLKRELFDKQMDFQKDELGRTQFNLRQLLDYQLLTAKNDEALKNFEQEVINQSQLRMAILKAAHQKVTQSLEQAHLYSEFEKDARVKTELAKAKAALERKMQREAARQRNRGAVFSAAGSLAGAAIGSAVPGVGTAVGVSVGATLGSGVGSLAGALT